MKLRNRFVTMLMAGIVASASLSPVGGSLFAQQVEEGVNSESMSISGSPVTKQLEKGDQFNLFIDVYTTKSVDELRKSMQYIELEGSTTHSVDVQGVQIIEKENTKTIVVMDLVYNGTGKMVDIEIGFKDGSKGAKGSITLENAQSTLTASMGLTLSENVLNVVAGETQQITLTVKNKSKAYVEAGTMELKIKDPKSAKGIQLKKKKIDLSAMDKGAQKEYYVSVEIDKDVTRGIHEMEVKIGEAIHTVKLKVDSNFMPPSLEVAVNKTSAFEQNVPKTVEVSIKNVGHVAAKNVKLEIVPNEKVFVANGSNVRHVENIESGKTQVVPISLAVGDTSSANLPVELKLSYINDLGETQTSSQFIYLSSKGSVVQKELEMLTTVEPIGIKKVGDNFNVGFKVTAPDEAKNVKISVKAPDGIVSKSKSIFIEPKLTAGQSKSYQVTFVATQGVTTGTYPIEIVAEYMLNGKEVAINTYTTVSIEHAKENTEEKTKGKPKVIIGTYSSNPVVVKAGESFDLSIGFLNTHHNKTVKNLKANLTVKEQGEKDTGSVFTPVNASNTFYISELTPGQTEIKNIQLYTIPSAKPKTYEITLEMEYEDEKGEAITATEHFGIPVEQVTKLEVAEVKVETVEVGTPTELTANIYNTGKTGISNVRIKTIGEGFKVEDNTMIIGNLEQGSSKTYMPTLIPEQSGTLTGQIEIEYEEITGQVQTYHYDFQLEVSESMPNIDDQFNMNEMPMEEEKSGQGFVILGIILGVGAAAGVTTLVLKKWKRRLEEMNRDED
jgi:hypothetical protein